MLPLAKRMAKHTGKRRRYVKYLKGKVTEDFALGTLAAKTIIAQLLSDNLTEKAWLSSVKLKWAISQVTPVTDVGPVMVGVAHSDYTATEIEEWIENAASWEQGNEVAQEIAKRKIRECGIFDTPLAVQDAVALNEGRAFTVKCGWMLTTGQTLRVWAYNMGGQPFATTDPQVSVNGHANLWPR